MHLVVHQLFLFTIAAMVLLAGCAGEDEYSSIPALATEAVPYTYEGRLGRIWGGDNFEVVHEEKLHYVFIRGIDTPEPGQAFHEEANEILATACQGRVVVVSVLQRDDWKREVCDVIVKDPVDEKEFDVALELVQNGLAWHDLNEESWSDRYREAEEVARSKKIGIWSQDNPVPPWEYWERQLHEAHGLKGQVE